ncbi:DUF21 domain-containing protein At1g47330 isoform X1 [Humulus lupulus]|uniref:DUF21 domain-containing protein At1g47330 isoform X1 n=1 Tax=Humulus lupulus TaxID=3486 RepID=UPI002B40BE3B|nr:DUF21 domain-containing protein At1g47330 isoform X1 [Humulus lupulus]XP_062097949.1 DUF21 domain-containing protein At1g47330 isoform X1 [Humulus lupulus]
MASDVPCCGSLFWLYALVSIGLVCFAGLMAGLTLGLMSLGLVDLEVLMKSGRPQDRKHAAKIYPVVKNQHLLLCTLLMGNALAMEVYLRDAVLEFVDVIWRLSQKVYVCTHTQHIQLVINHTHVLFQILPQAVCTRYGLTIGAKLAPFVRVLLMLFFPISYPISKVLDWMLGKGHAVLLRRAELKTFVNFHGNEAGKGGDLTHDETTIITGALELTEKTAKDAMTPISNAFSLDLDANLNLETLNSIMTMGHSRVPVYAGNPKNIIGLILVKNLLAVDPDDAVPLRKMILRKIPRVSENMPLYDILNEFQKGHSHIAVVYKDLNEKKETPQIDQFGPLSKKDDKVVSHPGAKENFGFHDAQTNMNKSIGVQQMKKSPPSTPAFKKRHRGCSYCILDIENTPIPDFSLNEEVVGVISMEDVIEELLQEEILDETDEYVNIHNRIKVNMHASQENAYKLASPQPSQNGSSIATAHSPDSNRVGGPDQTSSLSVSNTASAKVSC